MDFGLGFYCVANQSTTAVGQKVTRHLCVGCSQEAGSEDCGTGSGGSSQSHKEPFRVVAGAQPRGVVPACAWPAALVHGSALSVLCASAESLLADVSPLVLICQG